MHCLLLAQIQESTPICLPKANPGELFIVRNAGNIVPPHRDSVGGEEATIEYAISSSWY